MTERVNGLRKPAAALLVVGSLLVGCGGGGNAEPEATFTPATASRPANAAPVTPAIPEVRLQAVPLRLEELPTGWSEASTDDDETSEFEGECGQRFADVDYDKIDDNPRASVVKVSYAQGQVTELKQSVASLPSDLELATGFDELQALIKDCPEVAFRDDGERYLLGLGRTSFPALGDQALTFTARLERIR